MKALAAIFVGIALFGTAAAGDALFSAEPNSARPVLVSETSGAPAPVSRVRGKVAGSSPALLALPQLSFTEIDSDRDGKISFDELYRADASSLTSLRGQ
jgi:hypothetical protein